MFCYSNEVYPFREPVLKKNKMNRKEEIIARLLASYLKHCEPYTIKKGEKNSLCIYSYE